MIQKELLNELTLRAVAPFDQITAGTVETGQPQVEGVFDGKIVLRKPIGEERNGGSLKKERN